MELTENQTLTVINRIKLRTHTQGHATTAINFTDRRKEYLQQIVLGKLDTCRRMIPGLSFTLHKNQL